MGSDDELEHEGGKMRDHGTNVMFRHKQAYKEGGGTHAPTAQQSSGSGHVRRELNTG